MKKKKNIIKNFNRKSNINFFNKEFYNRYKWDSENKAIQLGLCCLNITLKAQKPPTYTSRKIIMRIIKERGMDELKRRITDNLKILVKMIEWNEQNGIKVFRLSSELFMHKTNPKVEDYSFDFALDLLKQAGDLAKKYNQRLTFHPGQCKLLGTPHINTYKLFEN